MILDKIISIGFSDRGAKSTKGYAGSLLSFGEGKIWIGDISRANRTIEWVQYRSTDFTDRSEEGDLE